MRDLNQHSSSATLTARLETISRVLGYAVAALGLVVMVGWLLNIPAVESLLPDLATMKFNTALLFLLSGFVLTRTKSSDRTIQVCAAMVVIIAGLTLVEYIFGWSLGIDELLVRDTATISQNGDYAGRMSIMTAVDFVLVGSGVLLLHRRALMAQILALVAGLVAFLALTGYLYGVSALYQIIPYSSMALHTALAFLLLSLGILFAKPDDALMQIVTDTSAGGLLVRRLLPAVILLPLLFGWLRLQGQALGWYANQFGTALTSLSFVIFFALIVMWTAQYLRHIDLQRIQAEAARQAAYDQLEQRVEARTAELAKANHTLQASEARFAGVLNTAHDAVISIDEQQNIILFNQGAERIFGYRIDEVVGRPLDVLMPQRFSTEHPQHIADFSNSGLVTRIMAPDRPEIRGRRKNGEEFPADVSISSLVVEGTRIFTAVLRDVTERQQAEERFRALMESAPDAMVIVNQSGKIVLANSQTRLLFGYESDELLDKPVEMLIPEPFRTRHPEHRSGYTANPHVRGMGIGLELYALRKDGTQFPVEISLSPIETTQGVLIAAAVRDITERWEVQRALIVSEERYRLLVNGISDYAIYALDPAGNVVTWTESPSTLRAIPAKRYWGVIFRCSIRLRIRRSVCRKGI